MQTLEDRFDVHAGSEPADEEGFDRMTDQPPKLPRKPFGYDPMVVDQMLADRDSMLALAERRVREAEGKAARLEEQAAARDAAIAELNEKIKAAPVEAEPAPQPEPEEEPLTPQFMTEELARIIMAAEESTSQILTRARLSTRDHILEADRLWREVQTEVVRFAAWREQAESALGSVQSAIDSARAQIEAVPDKVQSALAPAVEAMVKVDSQMAGFSAAANLPLLAAPSGLEEIRARMEAPETSMAEALAALSAPVSETPPPDAVRGPSESDWPSLGEPLSLNSDDAVNAGAEAVAEEASHELRQFQASREAQSSVEGGSDVWGA
jgi:hypothetical protein